MSQVHHVSVAHRPGPSPSVRPHIATLKQQDQWPVGRNRAGVLHSCPHGLHQGDMRLLRCLRMGN